MRRSIAGDATIWVILVVVIVAGGIYMTMKLAPVYSAKWEFEDRMRTEMLRLSVIDREEMYSNLQNWADRHKVPVNMWKDCTFYGEVGQEAEMVCKYTYDLHLFANRYTYVMNIKAEKLVPEVPYTSH